MSWRNLHISSWLPSGHLRSPVGWSWPTQSINHGPSELLMALYFEWCLLTLNSNAICAQKAETHNAPQPASSTPVLVNYHSGFYHRSAHLPSLQQILEVVNILYNPQSSSSDLLLIYFHHSHLFTKDVGRLSDMTVAYSSNLVSESTPPWPPTRTVRRPNSINSVLENASASTSICLCFAPSFCFMISFLNSNPQFWCLDSTLLALFFSDLTLSHWIVF